MPGVLDNATFGHPGKYTYCIAENEAASPWEPLHVERGMQPQDSTVTVYPAEAPHNINNHGSDNPRDMLTVVADCMSTLGSNHMYLGGECVVVFSPEHAATIAAAVARKRLLAAPLHALHGVVAGFLDNRKNNADTLLARIREMLHAQFHFADILWRHKFIYTRTAEPQILEELATHCHFVVMAIGD